MSPHDNGVTAASDVSNGTPDAGAIMQNAFSTGPKGLAHYADLRAIESGRFHALAEDPWADHDALNAREPPLKDGDKAKVVILGGGFGALLAAVRLIQQGFDADEIRFVDSAGGFGGTWYWNRYPGLHCDVESYIYLPFLEETGYVPTKKYSPGHEILEHSERIVKHWNLADKGLFRTQVSDLKWNESGRTWTVSLTENRGPGQSPRDLEVEAQYFIVACGVLSRPQVPKIPGLESFAGDMFHIPLGLECVIGTGATGIQVVPSLAKYAKELYVFQRTPSAVHRRDQRATDPHEWKTQIANKKGWQEERTLNFTSYVCRNDGPDALNLVGDEWSRIDSYHAQLGSTRKPPVEPTPEAIGAHIAEFVGLDLPHGEATRKRVDDIVRDKETAAKLKPWYPSWCKRPTFSDEYLQAFNLPNVHLVDTDGRGVESATEKGLVFGGKEYPLDVLVLSTGFTSPSAGNGDPALRSGIRVSGRGGLVFQDKWKARGATTLHGILSHDFPNLFFLSPLQAGSAPNNVHMLDVQARHIGYILGQAKSRNAATVEASAESEEAWSLMCMSGAAWYAPIPMCTPGYMTREGEGFGKQPEPAEAMKLARASPLSGGLISYDAILTEWREKGDLAGVVVEQ
ncbi:hypothetical protein INS49_014944 [Diaporthe citri]|uniref:uncharacterized protein n=1 Tax=Diaporthe citri TaxID=83186 RepID=UPI001C7E9CEE|nr:uncharacterized protein INS49_014944 [Diaporthe citri]KAG6357067.1 hypothetical protein INS49_014944 [Diaporthe citri]